MNAMDDLISRPKRHGKNTEAMLELVKTIDAMQAENARLRDIVQALAGWHTEAEDLSSAWQTFTATQMADGKLDDLCKKAWKALNDAS